MDSLHCWTSCFEGWKTSYSFKIRIFVIERVAMHTVYTLVYWFGCTLKMLSIQQTWIPKSSFRVFRDKNSWHPRCVPLHEAKNSVAWKSVHFIKRLHCELYFILIFEPGQPNSFPHNFRTHSTIERPIKVNCNKCGIRFSPYLHQLI